MGRDSRVRGLVLDAHGFRRGHMQSNHVVWVFGLLTQGGSLRQPCVKLLLECSTCVSSEHPVRQRDDRGCFWKVHITYVQRRTSA